MQDLLPGFPFACTYSRYTKEELFENAVEYIANIKDDDLHLRTVLLPKYNKGYMINDKMKHGTIIVCNDNELKDYMEVDMLTDFYNEYLRLSTSKRYFKKLTPAQIWQRDSQVIIEKTRSKYPKTKIDTLSFPSLLRSEFFNYAGESTNFRITVAITIYTIFEAKRILDISSGWGDRLLAALAYSRRTKDFELYYGVDPTIGLFEGYSNMIMDFGMECCTDQPYAEKFIMQNGPFEEVEILTPSDKPFDLVFTSIPYFDFEEFDIGKDSSTAQMQSIKKFPTQERWLYGFFLPSMIKASRLLCSGGHLAINMEQQFVPPALQLWEKTYSVDTFPYKIVYKGIIAYRSAKADRPIFVWQKL